MKPTQHRMMQHGGYAKRGPRTAARPSCVISGLFAARPAGNLVTDPSSGLTAARDGEGGPGG